MEKTKTDKKLKIKLKLEEIEKNIIESKEKNAETNKSRLEADINSRLSLIDELMFITNIQSFLDRVIFNKKNNLIAKLFEIELDSHQWSVLNKKETYETFETYIDKLFNEDENGNLLLSFKSLFRKKIILDKDKIKHIVNGEDTKGINILTNEAYKDLKEKLLTFIKTVLKYEFEIIEEEEYKERAIEEFYEILMFFDLNSIRKTEYLADLFINNSSHTKEKADELLKKIKNWVEEQKENKEFILNLIAAEIYHEAIEYIYFFSEEQKNIYKEIILENFSEELDEITTKVGRSTSTLASIIKGKFINEKLLLQRVRRKYDLIMEDE